MRAIAEYAMRGRRNALLVAVPTAALPLLYWLSTAIVSLVFLRKGINEGLVIALWAVLPALGWLMISSDPGPAITIAGTAVLAAVLRLTVSWAMTLAMSIVIGIVAGWVFEVAMPEIIAEFVALTQKLLLDTRPNLLEGVEQAELWLTRTWIGMLGYWQVMVMLACLMLGRWWQSSLFNPGGFGREFRLLYLPPAVSLGIVAAGAGSLIVASPYLIGWLPLMTLPLVIAGIAFVHWSVAKRHPPGDPGREWMGRAWLVMFYLSLVVAAQFVYPALLVVAILDSWIDLRGNRGYPPGGQPPAERPPDGRPPE